MRSRKPGLGWFLPLCFGMITALIMIQNHSHAVSHDPLDPNDCSRGIDEANQESCQDGAQ